jgi:hypothetical protein
MIDRGDTITLKEVYERVVALETKLEHIDESAAQTRVRFRNYVYMILGISILNIFLTLVSIYVHLRMFP